MRKSIFFGVLISVMLISCSKTSTPSGWAGTYNATSATGAINRVIVAQASATTLQVQLQTLSNGIYYTYVTLQSVAVNSPAAATVNENGLIAGFSDVYHFTGSILLSGNNITLSGDATSTTNASDVKPYYFTGSK